MELNFDLTGRREGSACRGAHGLGSFHRQGGRHPHRLRGDGAATAEDLEARLEAARGRLEGFIRRVAEDAAHYTLGLVKSHFPDADLEPVGDGVAPDTSDLS